MSDEYGEDVAGARPGPAQPSDERRGVFPDGLRQRLAAALRDELTRAWVAAVDRGVDPADLATSVTERTTRLRSPVGTVVQQPIQALRDPGHLVD